MNKSGIVPLEYKVVVLPKQPEDFSKGGIAIPDDVKERDEMAEVEGELVDVGPLAFEDWGTIPQVGSWVYFAKYAGVYVEGNDGLNYRIINDKDILAIRVRS